MCSSGSRPRWRSGRLEEPELRALLDGHARPRARPLVRRLARHHLPSHESFETAPAGTAALLDHVSARQRPFQPAPEVIASAMRNAVDRMSSSFGTRFGSSSSSEGAWRGRRSHPRLPQGRHGAAIAARGPNIDLGATCGRERSEERAAAARKAPPGGPASDGAGRRDPASQPRTQSLSKNRSGSESPFWRGRTGPPPTRRSRLRERPVPRPRRVPALPAPGRAGRPPLPGAGHPARLAPASVPGRAPGAFGAFSEFGEHAEVSPD